MLRCPPACLGQHAYKSPARQYRVEPAMLYAGATNYVATTDLQRSAEGRDSLGVLSQVQCSLIPKSNAQLFVACRTYSRASNEKLGVGLGTRLPRT